MNREKINSLMLDWYTGRCSLSRCLDEIEAEFKREHGEIPGKPEIPESVKLHLELLRKRADYQVAATVDENEVANWILNNLRDAVEAALRDHRGTIVSQQEELWRLRDIVGGRW